MLENTDAPRIRVGVIGVGQRAVIAGHLAAAGVGAGVTAAADPSERGRAAAAELFPGAVVVDDHHALIRGGLIDAAIVTTPDWTHAEIAIDLLNAGIPTFLEKPMALTVAETDAILDAAATSGTFLYIGHNFRHSAVVRLMREIVDRGEIGEVKAVWCRHFVGNGGDYYFKDWHADRSKVNSLLLQKAVHDLDVIHALAGGYTQRVVGMGSLMVYGDVTDRRDRSGERMGDWFSYENWPPSSQLGLNPVVDVEDVSMMLMTLDNGVQASYEQCHFTPDYWRNYTVIGTEGRLENRGDTAGGTVEVWNRRRGWSADGDRSYPITGVAEGHSDADELTVIEFIRHVALGEPVTLSPLAARAAVAAGALAADSLRNASQPRDVPLLSPSTIAHFTDPVRVDAR